MREFLRKEGVLRDGRVLTQAVVVFRMVEIDGGGRAITRRGRCYPLGELDPTMERGMLDDALWDARRERG
ncbi:hypothetical protein [Actinokineospora sp. HUAS TT18]|uniref:hypothetical protein n=1 Tax=Actinokineospora sp. HUAS TT18 TaxID=3447451 RepID=UPI003F51F4C4